MISKEKLIEIIISKAKSYGVEKGNVQIIPEILEDKKFFFFGLRSNDPFDWEARAFTPLFSPLRISV